MRLSWLFLYVVYLAVQQLLAFDGLPILTPYVRIRRATQNQRACTSKKEWTKQAILGRLLEGAGFENPNIPVSEAGLFSDDSFLEIFFPRVQKVEGWRIKGKAGAMSGPLDKRMGFVGSYTVSYLPPGKAEQTFAIINPASERETFYSKGSPANPEVITTEILHKPVKASAIRVTPDIWTGIPYLHFTVITCPLTAGSSPAIQKTEVVPQNTKTAAPVAENTGAFGMMTNMLAGMGSAVSNKAKEAASAVAQAGSSIKQSVMKQENKACSEEEEVVVRETLGGLLIDTGLQTKQAVKMAGISKNSFLEVDFPAPETILGWEIRGKEGRMNGPLDARAGFIDSYTVTYVNPAKETVTLLNPETGAEVFESKGSLSHPTDTTAVTLPTPISVSTIRVHPRLWSGVPYLEFRLLTCAEKAESPESVTEPTEVAQVEESESDVAFDRSGPEEDNEDDDDESDSSYDSDDTTDSSDTKKLHKREKFRNIVAQHSKAKVSGRGARDGVKSLIDQMKNDMAKSRSPEADQAAAAVEQANSETKRTVSVKPLCQGDMVWRYASRTVPVDHFTSSWQPDQAWRAVLGVRYRPYLFASDAHPTDQKLEINFVRRSKVNGIKVAGLSRGQALGDALHDWGSVRTFSLQYKKGPLGKWKPYWDSRGKKRTFTVGSRTANTAGNPSTFHLDNPLECEGVAIVPLSWDHKPYCARSHVCVCACVCVETEVDVVETKNGGEVVTVQETGVGGQQVPVVTVAGGGAEGTQTEQIDIGKKGGEEVVVVTNNGGTSGQAGSEKEIIEIKDSNAEEGRQSPEIDVVTGGDSASGSSVKEIVEIKDTNPNTGQQTPEIDVVTGGGSGNGSSVKEVVKIKDTNPDTGQQKLDMDVVTGEGSGSGNAVKEIIKIEEANSGQQDSETDLVSDGDLDTDITVEDDLDRVSRGTQTTDLRSGKRSADSKQPEAAEIDIFTNNGEKLQVSVREKAAKRARTKNPATKSSKAKKKVHDKHPGHKPSLSSLDRLILEDESEKEKEEDQPTEREITHGSARDEDVDVKLFRENYIGGDVEKPGPSVAETILDKIGDERLVSDSSADVKVYEKRKPSKLSQESLDEWLAEEEYTGGLNVKLVPNKKVSSNIPEEEQEEEDNTDADRTSLLADRKKYEDNEESSEDSDDDLDDDASKEADETIDIKLNKKIDKAATAGELAKALLEEAEQEEKLIEQLLRDTQSFKATKEKDSEVEIKLKNKKRKKGKSKAEKIKIKFPEEKRRGRRRKGRRRKQKRKREETRTGVWERRTDEDEEKTGETKPGENKGTNGGKSRTRRS